MNNFVFGLFSSTVFLCLLLFLEYLTRRNNIKKDLTRRVAHVLSSFFGILMSLLLEPWVFIFFLSLFLIIITTSYFVKFFHSIHGVKRRTYGEMFLPIGIFFSYLISGHTNYFVIAITVLAISDPLAGYFNDLNLFRSRNVGSIIFFISAFLILIFLLRNEQIFTLLLIAIIVTVVERFSSYGSDNFTIPIFVSFLLKYFL